MSLFVLREGTRVVSAPTGGRLVNLRIGKAIDLSPEEVQLLARASAKGLDSKDPSLRPLLERLAEEGMIRQRPAKADAPDDQPAPEAAKVPTPDNVVPRFLGSLKIRPQASSPLVEITDPQSGKTANLYDFEVSIARMLDGKRTCQEVVDAGQNIGIPVNLASLGQFLRQLRAYGFVEDPTPAPSGSVEHSPWPARERWSLEVRDLFRNGMRLFRLGNYIDAMSVLEEVMTLDPNNAEASELYRKTRARVTSADAEPEPSEEPLNDGGLDEALFGSGDAVIHTAPQIEVIRKNQTIARMMAALRRATGVHSLELKHVGIAAGVLLGLAVGATVLLSGGSKPKPEAAEAAAPTAAPEEKTAAAPEPSAPVAQGTTSTEAHPDAGAEPVAQAAAASGPQVELKLLSRRRVSLGKVKAPSAGKVSWSVQSSTRVKKGDALGFVAVKSKHVPLKASKEGLLLPRATEGATVKRGAIIAELVYGKAILQAEVAGARPTAKWACEVTDPASGQRAECAIFKVMQKGTGALVTGTTEPLWFDAAAAPVVRLTPP